MSSPFTICTPSIPERWKRLQECGESVRAQTHQPAAWLIRVEEPPEFGFAHLAHQRNALLKAVETEWIATLDDDDLLDPDYLEAILPYTAEADMIWGWCRGAGHDHWTHDEFNPERLRQHNYICGVACIRTEFARKVGGWPEEACRDEGMYEDWGMWLRLMDAGARFLCMGRSMWQHRRGDWRTIT